MKNTFLYKLLRKSKIFFVFAVIFITCYAIVLCKQMDMLIFPFNSMYASNTSKDFSTLTYAIKLNGNIVKITNDPYLKKDFSEGSLQIFSKWVKSGGKDFMRELLERKILDSVQRLSYSKKLIPAKNTIQTWPIWFLNFHHIKTKLGDNIEIWQFEFDLNNNNFILKDSSLVTKQTVIYE